MGTDPTGEWERLAMTTDDATWLVVVSGLIFVTWLPHLVFSYLRWRHPSRFPHTRFAPLRGLFVAVMLELGILRAMGAGFLALIPSIPWLDDIVLVLTAVLTLMVMSGGLLMAATWLVERNPWRRG